MTTATTTSLWRPRVPDRGSLVGPAGVVGVVLLWWLLAETVFSSSGSVPTPWSVLDTAHSDGWHFYGPNVSATVSSALKGFLWGNGLAIVVAFAVVLVPPLEAVAVQIAVISYCIPLVAVGPIVLIVFGGRIPSIFLAAISVFFTTLVGVLLGLRSADPTSLDVITAYGGGRLERLRRVQLVAALPASLAALKIAAPAAVLGAILGEYLGGVDTGLGVALTIAQQQVQVPRTWGLALTAGLVAGLGYAVVALLARLVAPWAESEGAGRR